MELVFKITIPISSPDQKNKKKKGPEFSEMGKIELE